MLLRLMASFVIMLAIMISVSCDRQKKITPNVQETTKKMDETAIDSDCLLQSFLSTWDKVADSENGENLDEGEITKEKDMFLAEVQKKHPALFVASSEVVNSFVEGTYDKVASKKAIDEYLLFLDKHDTVFSLIFLHYRKSYSENMLNDVDLEMFKRLLGVCVDSIKEARSTFDRRAENGGADTETGEKIDDAPGKTITGKGEDEK